MNSRAIIRAYFPPSSPVPQIIMKTFAQATIVLFVCGVVVLAQHTNHPVPKAETPIRLLDPTGFVRKKVSTRNIEAQKYFDQGLTLLYAYNEWDAAKSFKRAAELDPSLAIAWWGVATSMMPGTGQPDYAEKIKEPRDAMVKAMTLPAPPAERAYIEALAKRFSDAEKPDRKALDAAYSAAMKKIYESSPNDPDAAALFAGSNGWDWTKDGKPINKTAETVRVLEEGLRQHPRHLGLNHIYIHAVEASSQPERALRSADLLRSLKLRDPELGHLVHMPAHIYVRIGDFQRAAESNMETARMVNVGMSPEFKDWHFGHVFSFLRFSYYMQGNYAKLRANSIASFEYAFPNPTADDIRMRSVDLNSMIRFRRWKDILDLQISEEPPFPNLHYARAFAFAATGKVAEAEEQNRKYLAACKCGPDLAIPPGAEEWVADRDRMTVVNVSRLAARIAAVKGDYDRALEYLQKAVAIEDEISYSEPPQAIEPIRVNLGGLLLRMRRFVEAEKIFRDDLQRNRGNGRSLFGLMKALEAQEKLKEAKRIEREFREAWKYADTELTIDDL